MATNTWKLQDAKARFSEVVRKAREGEPQEVTVHGKRAVAIVDLDRFEVRLKERSEETMAGFMERSRQYRGLADDIDFEQNHPMVVRDKRLEIFDAELFDEKKK
jgi:prevent-host-death family protein